MECEMLYDEMGSDSFVWEVDVYTTEVWNSLLL